MAGGIHQNQCAQNARLAVGQGGNRLLQAEFDVADGVGLNLGRIVLLQRVDVQAVDDALDLGLDPTVAMGPR